MTENLILGGLEVSVEHAKKLASEYMNQHGLWSYPAYDSYEGNGDRNSVGPQDSLAAGLLNAGQKTLTTQYSFLRLLKHIDPLLCSEHLTGTLDEAGDSIGNREALRCSGRQADAAVAPDQTG